MTLSANRFSTPTPILSLRPTQMTLGMNEVFHKRDAWKEQDRARTWPNSLARTWCRSSLGLEGEHYLIDHHHLARALYEEGVESVFVTVVADLSRLPADHFWNMMDFPRLDPSLRLRRDGGGPIPTCRKRSRAWRTIPIGRLPANCAHIGGFAKDSTPFSEFLWADFLRPRIKAKAIKADFNAALAEALVLAKTGDADYLPGWCGPHGFTHAPAKNRKVKAKQRKAKAGIAPSNERSPASP